MQFETVQESAVTLDFVRSSELTTKFGNTIAAVRKWDLQALVSRVAKQCNVRFEKDTGDGAFLTFPTEMDAACCAVAVLQHLPKLNEPVSRPEYEIHVRIGISLGELIVDPTDDRKGEAANLSARLESMAPNELLHDCGGIAVDEFRRLSRDRILVSGEAYDGLHHRYPLRYVGLLKPKSVRRRYEVFMLDWERIA